MKFMASNASLLAQIKSYKKRAAQFKSYLDLHPQEWGRKQSEFNQEINAIFRQLMIFEKQNLLHGKEEKVYKLKKIFIEQLRKDFVRGEFLRRSLEKPFGYAGDYLIIDDIYRNRPTSHGFERLFDNYFQMSAISVAVRNRKDDFKRMILEYARTHQGKTIKIMSLASGPGRDLKELLHGEHAHLFEKAHVECYDADPKALEHSRQLLNHDVRVHPVQMNIIRMALNKKIEKDFARDYDIIFSTGLFDYLDERISLKLISNLRKLLKPGGILAISDVRDKFSNPSIYFMEWVADWNLVYREDEEFRSFFIRAGFQAKNLRTDFEQQGILQYVIAKKE